MVSIMLKKISLLGLMIFVLSCAENENDKIGDAQFCLDNLTDYSATNVNACTAGIAKLESKDAYLVRCSANFIIEGFADPNKFLTAINQLSSSSSSNPTMSMMGLLTFKSQGSDAAGIAANKVFAAETFDYCKLSGSAGSILISSFVNMATTIAGALGPTANLFEPGHTITPEEMQTAIVDLAGSSDEVLGATAQVAYQASCATADKTNADLCATLSTAVGDTTDPAVIGAALRAQLQAGGGSSN
jgi:hypothetical protein